MTDPFADAAAGILASVGVSATFRPQSGSEVATRVFRSAETELAGQELRVMEHRETLLCKVSDVGLPRAGDEFDVDGTTYTVDAPAEEPGDGHLVRVAVR